MAMEWSDQEPMPVELARFELERTRGTRKAALAIAREYLRGHPEVILQAKERSAELAGIPVEAVQLEEVVALVDQFREAGFDAARIRVDMALMTGAVFEPEVVGFVDVKVPGPDAKDREILERMDHEWRRNPDRSLAYDLARAYVSAHRTRLAKAFGGLSLPQVVKLLEQERDAGRAMQVLVVEAWQRSEFAPQSISGKAHLRVTERSIQQALDRKRALR